MIKASLFSKLILLLLHASSEKWLFAEKQFVFTSRNQEGPWRKFCLAGLSVPYRVLQRFPRLPLDF
jgi:hypothetical protein